ncbi:MAG: hypothetical protein MK116_09590 [Phycisphaerales bacterium]|nr:hypothetical protein [Phycisphaerales bacterium]
MTQSWESTDFTNDDFVDDHVEADALDVPSFARSSRKRPAILLVTVAAGSLVAIVTMRTLTGGIGQVMADTGMDTAVNGFLEFMRHGTAESESPTTAEGDPFADLVTDHYAAMQIPLEDLRSNPFVTPWTVQHATPVANTRTAMSPSQQRRIRRSELLGCADLMLVQSVMTGSNPIATINDHVVRIGDRVVLDEEDAIFTLRQVDTHGIQVEAVDPDLNLQVTFAVPLRRE